MQSDFVLESVFYRFKLEERTRYVDRLTSVEFREARVKGLNNNFSTVQTVSVQLLLKPNNSVWYNLSLLKFVFILILPCWCRIQLME